MKKFLIIPVVLGLLLSASSARAAFNYDTEISASEPNRNPLSISVSFDDFDVDTECLAQVGGPSEAWFIRATTEDPDVLYYDGPSYPTSTLSGSITFSPEPGGYDTIAAWVVCIPEGGGEEVGLNFFSVDGGGFPTVMVLSAVAGFSMPSSSGSNIGSKITEFFADPGTRGVVMVVAALIFFFWITGLALRSGEEALERAEKEERRARKNLDRIKQGKVYRG